MSEKLLMDDPEIKHQDLRLVRDGGIEAPLVTAENSLTHLNIFLRPNSLRMLS